LLFPLVLTEEAVITGTTYNGNVVFDLLFFAGAAMQKTSVVTHIKSC
jgi:hypothetical protein